MIGQITEHAEEGGITSKRPYENLQSGRGEPSTRKHQIMWINRWTAFRIKILQVEAETAEDLSGEDIARFFNAMIDIIRATPGAVDPGIESFRKAQEYLKEFGTFKYETFHRTAYAICGNGIFAFTRHPLSFLSRHPSITLWPATVAK